MAQFHKLTLWVITLVILAACDIVITNPSPAAEPTSGYSLGSLRLGSSEIRQRTTFHRVRNCQGTNNPVRLSSDYSLGNSVEWRVGSRAGFGVQIGTDAIPVNISLEAALDGQLAAQVTSSGNHAEEQTLSGLEDSIVEYEILWFETWQSATIPLAPPSGNAISIELIYLTNVQTEIANESVYECSNAQDTLQSPTQIPPVRTAVVPTVISTQTQPVTVVETYCYGECWVYDENARTMRWTGYSDGREDVWQPQGTSLERVRAGYTVIFGPMLVPGEIFACRLVIDGEVRKNACDGANVFVPAGVELRVISDGNVGGFRWCPREGYGYRADQSYQCR